MVFFCFHSFGVCAWIFFFRKKLAMLLLCVFFVSSIKIQGYGLLKDFASEKGI
jgi:hypothetical protein